MERVGGIHTNISRLLSIIGGYNYKYHATQIAKEYNLNREDVIRVMEISETKLAKTTHGLFNAYFSMLRSGVPIEEIEAKEKQRFIDAYNKVMGNVYDKLINAGKLLPVGDSVGL
jgi:hypothetical protein